MNHNIHSQIDGNLGPQSGVNVSEGGHEQPAYSPTILCLHGWRSNNEVTKTHSRNLCLSRWYSGGVHYIEGSVQAPGPPDDATDEFFDGPFFSWFETESHDAEEKMLQSMHAVIAYVKSHGPFDCAYGFSQGGAMVALLSFPEIVFELTGARMQLWRSVVLACSTIIRARMIAEKLWNINLENINIPVPSFHLIGMEDMLRQESEQAMRMFAYRRCSSVTALHYLQHNPRQKGTNAIIRSIYYIPGGHAVRFFSCFRAGFCPIRVLIRHTCRFHPH